MNDKKPIKADKKQIVIEYINKNGSITNKEARELLSLAESTTKRFLGDLARDGLLVTEGEKKARRYVIGGK